MISCITSSVSLSTLGVLVSELGNSIYALRIPLNYVYTHLLVASSRISTFPFRTIARARQRSCFWPCDHEMGFMAMSRPPSFSILSHKCSFCKAAMILSSDAYWRGSILKRTVPVTKKGSCVMTFNFMRISAREYSESSTPSMFMEPCCIPTIRKSARICVVVPLPDGPQIALFSPARIDIEMPFSTAGDVVLIESYE